MQIFGTIPFRLKYMINDCLMQGGGSPPPCIGYDGKRQLGGGPLFANKTKFAKLCLQLNDSTASNCTGQKSLKIFSISTKKENFQSDGLGTPIGTKGLSQPGKLEFMKTQRINSPSQSNRLGGVK